jgi:hypothetical protein
MQLWRQVPSYNPLQIRDRIILDIDSVAGFFSLLTVRARARHVDCWELSIQSCYSESMTSDNRVSDSITILTAPFESVQISDEVDDLFNSALGFFLKLDNVVLPSRYSFSLCCCSPIHFTLTLFWKQVGRFDDSLIESEIGNAPFHTFPATLTIVRKTAIFIDGRFDGTGESGIRNSCK